MKGKVKYFSIIALIFIFTLLLLNTKSYAGSQRLKSLNYDVQLNADGTVDVEEEWNIRVSDTNTLFKTFDLDSTKYGKITNVKVSDITDGMAKEFINTGVYAYHVEKGGFYALDRSSKEFEIAWGVSIDNTENKVYKIKYTITDAIKKYNDCSEFYWQFIGKTNAIPANKVTGKIKLPSAVSDKENLKVWAHGPLNGNIQIVDNETVSFEVKDVGIQEMIEVRVVTVEGMFMRKVKYKTRYASKYNI